MAIYAAAAPGDTGHAAALSNLGNLAFAREDAATALAYFDRALAVDRNAGARAGSDLARIQGRRGRVLTELGRFDEAEAAFVDAQRGFVETLGLEHPSAWLAVAGHAFLACRRGDAPQAAARFASLAPLLAGGSGWRHAEVEALTNCWPRPWATLQGLSPALHLLCGGTRAPREPVQGTTSRRRRGGLWMR